MADITITIPNAILSRMAVNYGWREDMGITKAQFARQQLIAFLKENVKAYEAQKAAEEARQSAISSADTDIVLS